MKRVAMRKNGGLVLFLRAWKKRLLVALGIASITAASAAALAQQNVPQAWLEFAAQASRQFEAQLAQEDSDCVRRLHAGLTQRSGAAASDVGDQLVVRVWVAGDGRVARVTFATLGDAQLDQDLTTILAAKPLPPPPPDMRQPMVLRLRLGLKT